MEELFHKVVILFGIPRFTGGSLSICFNAREVTLSRFRGLVS